MEHVWECCICKDSNQEEIVIIKHKNDKTLDVSRKRGHYFHKVCLQTWRLYQSVCPLDRDHIATIHNIPGYQVRGLELGKYGYEYSALLSEIKPTDRLLDQFIDINEVDKNNRSIAFYACKYGNYALVCRLLRRGANFNQPNGTLGFTPLMVAVCHNHHKIVAKILSNRNTVMAGQIYDKSGITAFGYACKYGYNKIISEFLDRKLVSIHQVRYNLELYRTNYAKDTLYGSEIIDKICHYLKTDHY